MEKKNIKQNNQCKVSFYKVKHFSELFFFRALGDIRESIEELKYYRQTVFKWYNITLCFSWVSSIFSIVYIMINCVNDHHFKVYLAHSRTLTWHKTNLWEHLYPISRSLTVLQPVFQFRRWIWQHIHCQLQLFQVDCEFCLYMVCC